MHTPRKRFGQNFLVDQQVIHDIVYAIHPIADDVMVEIGPGLGALTRPLLDTLKHLHVVEIDRDIVHTLQKQYPPEQLTIHAADALKFDFGSLGERFRVVGNLPYNISTPLLFHLADFASRVIDMHFMLQKEVVERMVAAPSSSDYGRLSVMLQYRFEMENLLTVPPGAFRPAPKVESAVVRMIPYLALPHPAHNEQLFARVVSAAFAQRRKTLRNTLSLYLKPDDFITLAIDPVLRAENLGMADFVKIANYVEAAGGPTPSAEDAP
jgi:16S rRNA (adenine1518-N6/adenine1519-N6)-dimethyltransferase